MTKNASVVSSTKPNLNMLRSTETESVAVDDCIPAKYGLDIGWTLRDIMILRTLYIKTIKVIYF